LSKREEKDRPEVLAFSKSYRPSKPAENVFDKISFMRITILLVSLISTAALSACQAESLNEAPAAETTSAVAPAEIRQLTAAEARPLVEKPDAQFIDVRTASEFEGGHAPKAVNYPLDKLDAELGKLDKERPVYLICETGRRSKLGAEILQKNGFTDIYNIEGGTSGWTAAGFPLEE
jgi:rhodanese-related sulfurtransferase